MNLTAIKECVRTWLLRKYFLQRMLFASRWFRPILAGVAPTAHVTHWHMIDSPNNLSYIPMIPLPIHYFDTVPSESISHEIVDLLTGIRTIFSFKLY